VGRYVGRYEGLQTPAQVTAVYSLTCIVRRWLVTHLAGLCNTRYDFESVPCVSLSHCPIKLQIVQSRKMAVIETHII